MADELKTLRFLKDCPPFAKGDIGGVPAELAEALVEKKAAEPYSAPKKDAEPKK